MLNCISTYNLHRVGSSSLILSAIIISDIINMLSSVRMILPSIEIIQSLICTVLGTSSDIMPKFAIVVGTNSTSYHVCLKHILSILLTMYDITEHVTE